MQIKSKDRVANHGEVFTNIREVNAMLDLVKDETHRIDSRFLEPACGTGNFLIEVLRRKLEVVESRYKKSKIEFERYSILALSSIYGIDILEDNLKECKTRLYELFLNCYKSIFKKDIDAGGTLFSEDKLFSTYEEVQKMLQSGRISQQQLNQVQQMAGQFQHMLKGMK